MISIDKLPDDVLLEIFEFYVTKDESDDGDESDDEDEGEGEGESEGKGKDDDEDEFKQEIEVWQTLVHVCQRWRGVVFESPRRLDLRLVCTRRTPARDMLEIWPSLPLLIWDFDNRTEGVDEIISVLEHNDRVVEIHFFGVDGSEWENILAAMQVPFPELTRLLLHLRNNEIVSVLPNLFLGGSAPRLESLMLKGFPYPGLLTLLLSATHLVDLHLENIPHSGYISPEAMVTALSALTSLARLSFEFESPQSRPHWASRCPPPLIRSVLPRLMSFQFRGVCEYLEDLVARIDAPQLQMLYITFFNQIVFDTPQFIQFISRTSSLGKFEKAVVAFEDDNASIILSSQTSDYGNLNVVIPCKELDWQVSSMEQVCTSCLPSLSSLEDLYIHERPHSQLVWKDNIENALWLELLQPFIAVKNLYLSEKFASRIMPALQELVRSRTTEVLPTLQNIFLETLQPSGTVQVAVQQFIATRQITGHPIAVSRWDNSKQDIARNR